MLRRLVLAGDPEVEAASPFQDTLLNRDMLARIVQSLPAGDQRIHHRPDLIQLIVCILRQTTVVVEMKIFGNQLESVSGHAIVEVRSR